MNERACYAGNGHVWQSIRLNLEEQLNQTKGVLLIRVIDAINSRAKMIVKLASRKQLVLVIASCFYRRLFA
jgi:hypothetical protein